MLSITQNQCQSREQQQQPGEVIEESEPIIKTKRSTLKTNLASEATCVLLPVRSELEPQPPRLFGGRDDLSISILECSGNLRGHPPDLNVKGVEWCVQSS